MYRCLWSLIGFILLIGYVSPAGARDYMVEFFEENFREKMIVGGGEPKIYHSMQVKTQFGDKLLVLVGDDLGYRKWLRDLMHDHSLFVVKIPAAGDQSFIYDRVVLVNIQQVHAVWDKYWQCKKCRHGEPPLPLDEKTPPVIMPQ